MTEEYVPFVHRWVRWNRDGTGDSTAKESNGEWYRGDAYFNNDSVWRRFVKDGAGKPLIISKSLWSYTSGGHCDMVPLMYVPCVGIFSRFPDDRLPIEAMHERNKFLILSRIIHVVYEEVPTKNAKFWADNDYSTQNFKEDVKGVMDAWTIYSSRFRLKDWGALPPIYEMSYKEAIETKVRSYMDPKEVNKRERAVARRIAKQAFDRSGG